MNNISDLIHKTKRKDKIKCISLFVNSLKLNTCRNGTSIKSNDFLTENIKTKLTYYHFPEFRKLIEEIIPDIGIQDIRFIMDQCCVIDYGINKQSQNIKFFTADFVSIFDALIVYGNNKLLKYIMIQ